MRSWWFLLVLVLPLAAVQTNQTIDDASPLVQKTAPSNCPNCTDAKFWGLDTSRLFDHTFSVFTELELNFTGTGLYMFIVVPSTDNQTGFDFTMDGVAFARRFNTAPQKTPQYNVSAYTNTSIPNGPHTFRMGMSTDFDLGFFDYAIFTSDDPDPIASSSSQTPGPGTPTGSSRTSTPHKKRPVTEIAGGVVGGAALLLVFFVGLMFESGSPSSNALIISKEAVTPAPDAMPPAQPPQVNSAAPPSEQDNAGVTAEQFRILQEELQQLRQRIEGSSTTVSATRSESPGRSLSTMKREQTRALVEHARGSGVTDTLVHTNSGLRLTAGRVADDPPPTYVAD
ncbi:hypothetical protein B0H13DRAFT_2301075 [Mycena leptocephala]|nr:hypothetical protein B0H13DRAFT_2301075 [Mycena leptocephala]